MTILQSNRYLPEQPDPQALDPQAIAPEPGPIGVLMVNLGTPEAPTPRAVRRYLAEFLSDTRVVELPSWLWQIILRGVILTRRPSAIAPKYRDIWLPQGSPLLVWSQAQADAVAREFTASGKAVRVRLAMRYGAPSIADGLAALRSEGCERILTVPMYPQYAASTTATAVDAVCRVAARLRNQPELRFIKRFSSDPAYIEALYASVQAHWAQEGEPDRLLLSFHGLPQRVVRQGDPYFRDCMQTVRLLRERLGQSGARLYVTFQSRFGTEPWLQPYTLPTLTQWGEQGVGRVDVLCPGFLADCLETLEEINIECREAFLHAGGRAFHYIPCLNDDPVWGRAFAGIIERQLLGWD
ncbi:ferrochelatase [Alcaligenaceae bacterium CGII-47]|nr:ferrochelatase [Alcaligenaceae bacterium CGII-47]